MNNGERRLSSGVEGIDRMLRGGFTPRDSILVAGSPGTGKTTLGLHFLVAGIQQGEPGVLVTFEYLPQQIYRDAAKRGWDLRAWEDEGLLRVICTSPSVLLSELEPGKSLLDDVIREVQAERLVIDSMTQFDFHDTPASEMRAQIAGLMNHLRLTSVTPLVTHEIPQITGPAMRISRTGLEFLADGVVLLRYVEFEGEMQKAINVLKFRGGDHDRHFHRYELTRSGFAVRNVFAGIENISSGTAHRSLAERALELV